jgi:ribose transport system permease protein
MFCLVSDETKQPQTSARFGRHGVKGLIGLEAIVLVIGVITFIAFGLVIDHRSPEPVFFTLENLLNLLRGASVLGLLGLGMTVVVIQRGIDLSLVSVMAVSAGWFLQKVQDGTQLYVALGLGLFLAVCVGIWNGVASTYLEIPPLFATLSASLFVYGLGRSQLMKLEVVDAPEHAPAWFNTLGSGRIAGIPAPILVFAVSATLLSLYLTQTRLGRLTYAVGDNPNAARLLGVAVRPTQVINFVIAAVIAYLAGLVVASSVASVNVRVAKGTMIYDVLLVAVLGGIGLSGGRGRVWGVVASTLLIGTLVNGMTLLNVSLSGQNIVRGVLLLTAITIDTLLHPRNEETAQQGDV